VPRLRFGQNDVRLELRGVRCGLPTIREFPVVARISMPSMASSLDDDSRPAARVLAGVWRLRVDGEEMEETLTCSENTVFGLVTVHKARNRSSSALSGIWYLGIRS